MYPGGDIGYMYPGGFQDTCIHVEYTGYMYPGVVYRIHVSRWSI